MFAEKSQRYVNLIIIHHLLLLQNSEGVKKPTAISNSSTIQQGKQQGKSKHQPVIAKKSQPEKVTPTKSKAGYVLSLLKSYKIEIL